MRQLKWTFAIVLLIIVATFTFENAAQVEYSFLGQVIEARRSAVVGLSLLVGILLGWLIATSRQRR